METEKLNKGSIAKTVLVGIAIMLLFSAIPHRVSTENAAKRLIPICHFGRTIRVDHVSWPYHQAHGDQLGVCTADPAKTNK